MTAPRLPDGRERLFVLEPLLLHRHDPLASRQHLVRRDPRYAARYHDGPRPVPIEGCVVHMTDGHSLLSSIEWQNRDIPKGESGRTSYHVGIEDDGTIYISLEYDTIAYHAGQSRFPGLRSINGSLNRTTLGVTLANKHSTRPATREGITREAYESLVWWLCVVPVERFGVCVDRIIGHLECSLTGKIDPWTYALRMDALRADVAAELVRRKRAGRVAA